MRLVKLMRSVQLTPAVLVSPLRGEENWRARGDFCNQSDEQEYCPAAHGEPSKELAIIFICDERRVDVAQHE